VYLCVMRGGYPVASHFKLREFENCRGLVMVDSSVVEGLESVRGKLCEVVGRDVQVVVTDAVRSDEDNMRLGLRAGWVDQGGVVARDSRHLERYGGIAVDVCARYKCAGAWVYVASEVIGKCACGFFDFVKCDYKDGHVHLDMRDRTEG